MAKLRRRQGQGEPMPMAPMIDMVFLLLVFFMTVSTIAQAPVKAVELSESDTSRVPDDVSGRGVITVDAAGQYYIGESELALDELESRIKAQLQQNPQLRLTVRADKQTKFKAIRKALDRCARVGVYDIIYATHQTRK